mgnify:CR=1 FL=1
MNQKGFGPQFLDRADQPRDEAGGIHAAQTDSQIGRRVAAGLTEHDAKARAHDHVHGGQRIGSQTLEAEEGVEVLGHEDILRERVWFDSVYAIANELQ